MKELTLKQIITAVGGKCLNDNVDLNMKVRTISIDSRKVDEQSLYIPIVGERFDGHLFIDDAFNKGASVSLTHNKKINNPKGILIHVKDTKVALGDLAAFYRRLFDIPVIAVTGSVGKTSTKDLVASLLKEKFKVHKTQGNFNNDIGLPLTIFQLKEEHDVLVLEMGMNHFGEISRLSKIAKPDLGIITNIGDSHVENLGSKAGILKAKSEIVDGMAPNGTLIINGEDTMLERLKVNQRVVSYGCSNQYDYYANNIRSLGIEGISATLNTRSSSIDVHLEALGRHMIENALAAFVVAKELGLSEEEIRAGFINYEPTKMRMDLINTNNLYIINDAYNASPDSMKAALDTMMDIANGRRRVAILGDMFEMGDHEEALHRNVGAYIAKKNLVDILLTVGSISNYIQEEAIEKGFDIEKTIHFKNQEDLIKSLGKIIKAGDLVLVKASRGMELEKTIEKLGKVNLDES